MYLCEGRVLHVRVSLDISMRDMLHCFVPNYKSLIHFHQVQAYGLMRINYYVNNVITIIPLITRMYWRNHSSTRKFPASWTLLTIILPIYLLCYRSDIVITSTTLAIVVTSTNINLAYSVHDFWFNIYETIGPMCWCVYWCRYRLWLHVWTKKYTP